MSSETPWPLNRLIRVWIAVGLAVVGVAMVWLAVVRPSGPDPALAGAAREDSGPSASTAAPDPTPEPPRAPAKQPDVRDQVKGLVLPESDPVRVTIPVVGVQSRLVDLGLDAKGAMEVPEPSRAGWFTRGAAPGALGPAVIAGHVTWNGAPSVFHRLGTMRRGDRVSVAREDGRTAVFSVSRVARFPKSGFPSEEVYGPIDHAGLRLITCGGTYDATDNTYRDNVIVFARLVAVHGPGG